MNVGIVMDTTMDSNDGVQQYVKSLGHWLLKHNHNVKFLVGQSSTKGEFGDKVISLSKNLTIKGNSNVFSTSLWPDKKKIEQTLAENKFDVLHVQTPYSPFMSEIILKSCDTPRVGTFHVMPDKSLPKTILRFVAKLEKKIVTIFSEIYSRF